MTYLPCQLTDMNNVLMIKLLFFRPDRDDNLKKNLQRMLKPVRTTLKLALTVIYYCSHPYFFLLNLYLKQGIRLVYVMVDFICNGSLEQ